MPAPNNYRKRRVAHGPNKNELKVSRSESEARDRQRAGTLRERFPDVQRLQIEYRMETASGAILTEANRQVAPDEILLLDIQCEGGCGNGQFLLTNAIEALLQNHTEQKDGLAICQATSYQDARVPCGTKLYYRFSADY
jgi:hypothetical protein